MSENTSTEVFAHPESLILEDNYHVKRAIRKAWDAKEQGLRGWYVWDTTNLKEVPVLDEEPSPQDLTFDQICVKIC
ncbi:hypothetical protein [Nostoc sp.]|uniref:hypothetical protein n=1 Tax=Nostoc sp. TaxID=1180 RepID=UPI002FF0E7C6